MENLKSVALTNSLAFSEGGQAHKVDYVAVKVDNNTVMVDGERGILIETELGSVFIQHAEQEVLVDA